jgi:DNA repair exonuclease SbcCD ATPase subunit
LVKRKNTEDDVEYFKIDKQLNENDFIDASGNLKKFDEIRKDLTLNNAIQSLKDKNDFFQWVYSKDTNRNAFLWINDSVKRKGQSLENSLTKTYRFLLNASSIDDNALREALIIADNRQGLSLDVFANKNKIETVEKLKNESNYINKLTKIKNEFENFKLLVNSTESKKKLVAELLYSFDELLKREVENLKLQIKQAETKINLYKQEEGIIKPKQTELSEKIGELKAEIRQLVNDKFPDKGKIYQKEEVVKEINQILKETSPLHITVETLTGFLETQQNSFQKQLNEVSAVLQSITQYNTSQKETESKIKSFTEKQKQLENKISKFQDLLIHNISESKEVREKLNAIFSEKVIATFTKNDIIQKIQSLGNILSINEGKFQGLDEIEAQPLESIEELNEQLATVEKDLKQQKDILDTLKNRAEKETQKGNLQSKINAIKAKITKISQKDSIENELAKLKKELQEFNTQLTEKESKHTEISNELTQITNLIKQQENSQVGAENKIKNYQNDWYPEFEQDIKNLLFQKFEVIETSSIEELRNRLRNEKNGLKDLVSKKQVKFSELQKETENYTAEPIFIEQIGQDMLTLKDKEKSIETLLEQVSNEFTQPVQTFLDAYKHFEEFIKKFNRSISDYKISDLTALKIELKANTSLFEDLEKISKIIRVDDFKTDLFNQFNTKEQQDYVKVLEEYINNRNREINFKELFEVRLNAYDENGKSKLIDLKVGNESQGTIRMINLILFLLVIKFFKTEDEENKLVFFIDEDVIDSSNTEQLIRFCKENGFVIIFAAKHQITGLEKYYFIKKSAQHQNKVFADERNVKFAQKK